ncbi:hypothetical protein BHM03_00010023 [Ensete ventricosum]|nr:hypothetical protein BHM03_00010023 [Ensete ventricosum]
MQGSPFRSVPLGTGVDFSRRRSISTVGGQLREKREKKIREKRGRYQLVFLGSPRFVTRGRIFIGRLPSPCTERRGEKGEWNEEKGTKSPHLPERGEGRTRRRLVSPFLFF